MLVTSSQASILLSSGIVLLFTTALFLSGCVIQQRTLRELRAAIKPTPRPTPKIFLPDRFKQATTELKDGTIVIVDTEQVQKLQAQKPVVVEVKRTESEAKEPAAPSPKEESLDAKAQKEAEEERIMILKGEKHGPLEQRDAEAEDEVLSDREKNMRHQRAENLNHPDPGAQDQSLMSRAQRRRLIKEELRKLHDVELRGYQRRLW